MFRHLLVPTDGSVLSDKAVEKAVAFAKESGAEITFFYAKPNYDASIYGEEALMEVLDPKLFQATVENKAQNILSKAEDMARAAGVRCDSLTSTSDEPHEAIIAAVQSKGCDLVLMASHGWRGVKGLILGSVTMKVLTHSTIPVLVYR